MLMLGARFCARMFGGAMLFVGCTGPATGSSTATAAAGSGAWTTADAAPTISGNAFGNSGGSTPDAGSSRVRFIDDGGIAVLADGAMLYAKFFARPCPVGSSLTYANFGAQFFQSYCLRCHSRARQGADRNDAPTTLNFDQLADIQTQAERIWGQAADSNVTMPAGAPRPSSQERMKLGEWLACGAPGGQADAH